MTECKKQVSRDHILTVPLKDTLAVTLSHSSPGDRRFFLCWIPSLMRLLNTEVPSAAVSLCQCFVIGHAWQNKTKQKQWPGRDRVLKDRVIWSQLFGRCFSWLEERGQPSCWSWALCGTGYPVHVTALSSVSQRASKWSQMVAGCELFIMWCKAIISPSDSCCLCQFHCLLLHLIHPPEFSPCK